VKKSCLVIVLVLCCCLSLAAVGCGGTTNTETPAAQTTATTAAAAATTTTTTPETTTTVPETTTTASATTTTAPPGPAIWTKLDPAGDLPAARAGHAMVYEPNSGKVILFGGWDATDFNDTWAYDPANNAWTDLDPAGDVPPGRHDHAMAYDAGTGKVILFGGMLASTYTELNDTWAYDPATNAWTNLDPTGDVPQSRCLHSMAYDPTTGKVILFGGSSHGGCLGDIWAYDSAANTWADLSPTGDAPLARYGCPLAYDPGLGRLLLFGGSDGHYLGDTWAYDSAANTWTNLVSVVSPVDKPSARQYSAMAYDSEAQRTILFGGYSLAALGDTWAYDSVANTWTNLNPAGDVPSAREYHSMVYATDAGKAILFGGSENKVAFDDTWGCDSTP
jgi:Galactose oxidase, central domain